jgi:predicted ATPase
VVGAGGDARGLARMRQGLTAYRATGAELGVPHFLAWLAEACGGAGQAEEGLHMLAEALSIVESQGQRWWEAELYRLQGELLLQQVGAGLKSAPTETEEAETCFRQALDVASHQEAKSLELRAAMSLARLWQQGKRTEARGLLAPIYGWFTEGFDTADLREAKALLETLS